jgi:hypothetical protein
LARFVCLCPDDFVAGCGPRTCVGVVSGLLAASAPGAFCEPFETVLVVAPVAGGEAGAEAAVARRHCRRVDRWPELPSW